MAYPIQVYDLGTIEGIVDNRSICHHWLPSACTHCHFRAALGLGESDPEDPDGHTLYSSHDTWVYDHECRQGASYVEFTHDDPSLSRLRHMGWGSDRRHIFTGPWPGCGPGGGVDQMGFDGGAVGAQQVGGGLGLGAEQAEPGVADAQGSVGLPDFGDAGQERFLVEEREDDRELHESRPQTPDPRRQTPDASKRIIFGLWRLASGRYGKKILLTWLPFMDKLDYNRRNTLWH